MLPRYPTDTVGEFVAEAYGLSTLSLLPGGPGALFTTS